MGINVRGANIDQVRLRCAAAGQVQANAFSLFATTGTVSLTRPVGGSGGSAAELPCPANHALRGVTGRLGRSGAGSVDRIRADCRKLLSTAISSTASLGSVFSGSISFSRSCPGDTVVTGLRGRAGSLIDQVQLVCQ